MFTLFPAILMIQLKCFAPITFSSVEPDNEFILNNIKYSLKSIIVHQGNWAIDGGHYVAYLREANGNWLKVDDDFIEYCNPPKIG